MGVQGSHSPAQGVRGAGSPPYASTPKGRHAPMTDALAAVAEFFHFAEAFGTGAVAGLWLALGLMAVAFVAGIIDGVAGGGGLLTIPSLMMAGLPPQLALGTNKVLSSMGTTLALTRFARSGLVWWRLALMGIPATLLGAAVGARLILAFPPALAGKLLVFLLPLAVLITLAPGGRAGRVEKTPTDRPLPVLATCFGVGMYDGFFGPGTGSFFILAFHFILGLDFLRASATTKAFNLASNVAALTVFLLHGTVFFRLGALFGLANMGGNWCGTRLAMRRGQTIVRRFLALALTLLFASLLYKYWLQ